MYCINKKRNNKNNKIEKIEVADEKKIIEI